MGQWDKWIGGVQEQSDILTPGLLGRFSATIDSDATGDIAPQGIHWCLCLPEAATAELGDDGHPYATDVEGYSGLVVHGPLIATLLLDLAAREFGANTLKKFSMRAQSAVFVGEPLHLVGKNEG
jgi:hydroxyacyl-ACP dehydratase HTD2-like protein with hotdog domain